MTVAATKNPGTAGTPRANEIVAGNVRVQLLSPTLVRLEERGPKGFEDRHTFLVVERDWPGTKFTVRKRGDATIIKTALYEVCIPGKGHQLRGIEVHGADGRLLYRVGVELPARPRFPAPSAAVKVFAVADNPRVVPPPWGATPPPKVALKKLGRLAETCGWELGNDAPDVYVFLNPRQGYEAMRREFLRLTGPIPLPPLFALGFWNSLYYPYTEKEALAVIDRYRREKIPLDVFVVDTDWRLGGSGGYDVEKKYFPNLRRFFREAHKRKVKVMFNDHPQPNDLKPLEPKMLEFRWKGLTTFLKMGLDFWWYDKNWPQIIDGPLPGLDCEEWGQRLYWDTHARTRRDERPMLMSMRSEHPASHRYPIWWTGDIHATWNDLKSGVMDSVNNGVRLLPWVNQDLGGHVGVPSPELYVRFLQWGCLSPVARVHGTFGQTRYPWAFGDEAQRIATDYIKLRYRLAPTLYAAARRAYDDGTPLLRRCDLEWRDVPEQFCSKQYLLGDDILVAPVVENATTRLLWLPSGDWENAWTGEVLTGPKIVEVAAPLAQTPMFVRRGGMILLAPDMQYTTEKPWDPVTVEVFPARRGTVKRELYEDDGRSLGYQRGEFARTTLELTRTGKRQLNLTIHPTCGDFPGRLKSRAWVVRFHLLAGEKVTPRVIPRQDSPTMPFCGSAGPKAGPVIEVSLPAAPTNRVRRITVRLV